MLQMTVYTGGSILFVWQIPHNIFNGHLTDIMMNGQHCQTKELYLMETIFIFEAIPNNNNTHILLINIFIVDY